mmetsp:Transcript_77492/g.187676  ORF Transcript_77492/g.187676 Transcript_77492/m.187676 type:complete len:235 (+) Transcript_77492:2528-3232(+)
MRLGSQALPPRRGFCTTCRCRPCCPPAQVLSQVSHSLQSESLQSLAWLHSWISCREASHATPPFVGASTARERERWPPWVQLLHSLQAPTAQSFTSPEQKPSPQTASSSMAPLHGSPPLDAVLRTARVRCFRPPRQLLVQADQALQPLSSQGVGRPGVEQNCVSARPPWHGAPPLAASCWIARLRYFWSWGSLHSLHAPQLESTQSCTFWHSWSQRLVSSRCPLQAWPLHLLSV